MRLKGSRAGEREARPRPGRRKEEKAKARSADAAGKKRRAEPREGGPGCSLFPSRSLAPPAAEMKRRRAAIIL